MTEFRVQRLLHNEKSTSGHFLDADGQQLAVTVEDAPHDVKIAGKTRIPSGRYRLALKPLGSSHFDAAYSKIFPDVHRGMIQIEGVPGFAGVLIHCGNTDLDTEGCILVGQHIDIGPEGYQIAGGTSRPTYAKLYPILLAAIEAGETWLSVMDEGRESAQPLVA